MIEPITEPLSPTQPHPPIPSRESVESWLREHVRRPAPSRIARWFGARAEFHYQVGQPQRIDQGFFVKHSIFSVMAERGLLPRPALPSGSFGYFAWNGSAIYLLRPDDDSVPTVFQHEDRALNEADPCWLGQFLCDVLLSPGCHRHVVLANEEALTTFGQDMPGGGYILNSNEVARIAGQVPPPSIARQASGEWLLTYASLTGWMHEVQELGLERLTISTDFRLTARVRTKLSRRIFRSMPLIRY